MMLSEEEKKKLGRMSLFWRRDDIAANLDAAGCAESDLMLPFSRPCEQLRLKKNGPRSDNLWFKQQPRRSQKNTHSHHSPSGTPAMERWHAWTPNTFPNYRFLKRHFVTDKTCTWNKSEQIKVLRLPFTGIRSVINNALVLYLCVCVLWHEYSTAHS